MHRSDRNRQRGSATVWMLGAVAVVMVVFAAYDQAAILAAAAGAWAWFRSPRRSAKTGEVLAACASRIGARVTRGRGRAGSGFGVLPAVRTNRVPTSTDTMRSWLVLFS